MASPFSLSSNSGDAGSAKSVGDSAIPNVGASLKLWFVSIAPKGGLWLNMSDVNVGYSLNVVIFFYLKP